MTEYISKEDIVNALLSEDKPLDYTLPRLAFNCCIQDIRCNNCGSVNEAQAFRHNASSGAGTNFVVFDWEVDLTRIIARGDVCYNCNRHNIILEYPIIEGSHRENDPKKIKNVDLGSHEVISSYSGDDKK